MAALGVRVSGRRLPTTPALRDVVVLLGVGRARLCGEKAVNEGVGYRRHCYGYACVTKSPLIIYVTCRL